MSKKKYFGVYLEPEVTSLFQRLYPRCASTFIRRALIRANNDKAFFNDVFFNTVDEFDNLGENNPSFHKIEVQ